MVMVMESQLSEWPMNSACVYVILCNVREDERLVQYVKEKEKIRKEIKVVCIVSLKFWCGAVRCGGGVLCVAVESDVIQVVRPDDLILTNFLLGLSRSPISILFIMAGLYVSNILSSNKKLISSWTVWTYVLSYWYVLHHHRCPYRGAPQSYTVYIHILIDLSSSSSGAYDMDQTSAFFIGVILGTALLAQKCQALIDATKASCVHFSSHTVTPFAHTRYSTFTLLLFVFDLIRLEERGWIVSSAHSSSSREGGGKGSASVVVVKTGKKKMDHERYLDATQRYVPRLISYLFIPCFTHFRAPACVLL